jgi:hypothetical protein
VPEKHVKTADVTFRWEALDGSVRTVARLEVPWAPAREITWRFEGALLPRPTERLDAAAVAFMPLAMNEGLHLRLRGRVSRPLLESLDEAAEAWRRWRPDLFGEVALEADEEVEDAPTGGRRAVLSFSGGVDATYALAAHRLGLVGRRTLDLQAAVFVHGFDLPIERPEWFARALPGARAITDHFGLPLTRCTTDWRRHVVDWEMGFGFGIGAVLHHFAGVADRGTWATDEPYEFEVIPWGSNSITNPLLSSGSFRMVQTGGGYSRAERVARIADIAAVREHVRVCWQKAGEGLNCGVCEKCLRTWVEFIAVGEDQVPALGSRPSPEQVAGIELHNRVQWNYLADVLAHGARLPDAYRAAVQSVLDRHREHGPGAVAPPQRRRRRRRGILSRLLGRRG